MGSQKVGHNRATFTFISRKNLTKITYLGVAELGFQPRLYYCKVYAPKHYPMLNVDRGWKDVWMDGWIDRSTGGYMDGWMDEWVGGWMSGCVGG